MRTRHLGNPARPMSQWDDAERDDAAVKRSMLRPKEDEIEFGQRSIVWLGDAEPVYPDGGSYRLAVIRFKVDYLEDIGTGE